MLPDVLRLVFWVAVAAWAFSRDSLDPQGRIHGANATLLGALGVLCTVWYTIRIVRRRLRANERRRFAEEPRPLRARSADDGRPEEYNPEFDFGAANRQPPPNGG